MMTVNDIHICPLSIFFEGAAAAGYYTTVKHFTNPFTGCQQQRISKSMCAMDTCACVYDYKLPTPEKYCAKFFLYGTPSVSDFIPRKDTPAVFFSTGPGAAKCKASITMILTSHSFSASVAQHPLNGLTSLLFASSIFSTSTMTVLVDYIVQ